MIRATGWTGFNYSVALFESSVWCRSIVELKASVWIAAGATAGGLQRKRKCFNIVNIEILSLNEFKLHWMNCSVSLWNWWEQHPVVQMVDDVTGSRRVKTNGCQIKLELTNECILDFISCLNSSSDEKSHFQDKQNSPLSKFY